MGRKEATDGGRFFYDWQRGDRRMVVVTRATKRRLKEESCDPELRKMRRVEELRRLRRLEEESGDPRLGEDLISRLPDDVLRGIITLLPTKDGTSTQFPMETACMLDFPHLKALTLSNVNIMDSALHGLLSRCPVLESLVLVGNRWCRCLHISSLTLQSLGVSDGFSSVEGKLEKVTIVDAPLLERLIIPRDKWQDDFVVRVTQAPKLEALGYLSDGISRLEIGTMVVQKLVPVSLSNVVRTVKILAINTNFYPNVVIDFIKCFPCVEKLYVKVRYYAYFNNVQQNVSLECLDLHLKMVEFINYQGNVEDLNFIRFFVLNALVLECMKLVTRRNKCDVKWIEEQHQKLQLYSGASRRVTFDFQADYEGDSLVHMKHISDLTTNDPFDRSFCRCRDEER
ncbi:hypothetical protein OsI_38708 [Oryza sativa Indica Group]|nr:hypothetical protein OsI_38708 [Oryza sativa Indica Group]EEE53416.1 hypothetical protein OsJ_36491 [Oryza sativa Japonica Group]